MKKLIYFIFLFSLIIPISVKADNTYIDKHYIDITVLDNGDALVKELLVYKGNFNGIFKTVSYDTDYSNTNDLLVEASMYSPKDVILNNIKEIQVDNNVNFNYLYNTGLSFTRNDSASVGSKGYYSITKGYKEYTYKIFNPGTFKGFYIEYTLEDVIVNHEDISEVWLNIIKGNEDYTEYLELLVNLPNNNNELRAWAHGPLYGNIEIIDKNSVKFTINDLNVMDSFDIRLAFDKYVTSSKNTGVIALDKIVNYETELADKANKEREELREYLEKLEKQEKTKASIFETLSYIWLIGLGFLFRYVHKNFDKEYASEFEGKYYREIPSDENPAVVGYLINKRIRSEDLSATILNLIYKKKIDFIELNNKDYKFVLKDSNNIDVLEEKVIKLLFEEKEEETLSNFKKRAKKSYDEFLKNYNSWSSESLKEANKKNFFESQAKIKLLSSLYAFLGFILLFLVNQYVNKIVFITVIILSIVAFIYFIAYTKRTKLGNEEYFKWIGLKNFMNDFGKMDIKELPEVKLWEKYLVYAVTLGCADKLIKTMKVKIKEINPDMDTSVNDIDLANRMYLVSNMNSVVTKSVNNAISSAKSVAASQNSSGSGYGGGFSSGGGFSGGGGGSSGHF